jgi:NAD(P)-dependent dehydrogenase (short-subunit alcohol dehydrogenase family)
VTQRNSQSPVALITGASSGIGRALAVCLGATGYRVGLIARREPLIQEASDQIKRAGGFASAAPVDVSDRDSLVAAVAQLESQLGPTDIMVANAGYGAPTHLDPLNVTDVEQTFRVNLFGVVYSIDCVLPGMLARKRGQIVAISSLAAFKGLPGESAYCASKAAVNAYTEGLRIALRDKGIIVTTVCPGFVQTDMTPMDSASPFAMTADEAARRIAKIIASRRSGVVRFPLPMAILTSLIARLVNMPAPEVPVEPAR